VENRVVPDAGMPSEVWFVKLCAVSMLTRRRRKLSKGPRFHDHRYPQAEIKDEDQGAVYFRDANREDT